MCAKVQWCFLLPITLHPLHSSWPRPHLSLLCGNNKPIFFSSPNYTRRPRAPFHHFHTTSLVSPTGMRALSFSASHAICSSASHDFRLSPTFLISITFYFYYYYYYYLYNTIFFSIFHSINYFRLFFSFFYYHNCFKKHGSISHVTIMQNELEIVVHKF